MGVSNNNTRKVTTMHWKFNNVRISSNNGLVSFNNARVSNNNALKLTTMYVYNNICL